MARPLILLVNDDGVGAPGLRALAEAVGEVGEVMVVAPERNHSGAGHAITLDRPLRVREHAPGWFGVEGTPVDCVYLALLHLCARRPAAALSGVNHGYNLGSDVFYSGTVAGAIEAALRGVPAVAVSAEAGTEDFARAAGFGAAIAAGLVDGRPLPPDTLLNVNVPAAARGEWRPGRLGRRHYRDTVARRTDLRGEPYYWIGGPESHLEDLPGSDSGAVARGLISVTALHLDMSAHPEAVEALPAPRGYRRVPEE